MSDPHDREIAAMFDRVATRYDYLNRILSFGTDIGWRRRRDPRAVASAGSRVRTALRLLLRSHPARDRDAAGRRPRGVSLSAAIAPNVPRSGASRGTAAGRRVRSRDP